MHEVVLRRYRKLLEQGGPFPDLILIDGGKGQLSAAYAALEELGLANLVAVGHREEGRAALHARSRRSDRAGRERSGAAAVQRIRDEAHRFAVTFHRRARTMRDLRSELDDVPGIGPRRRRTLLTTFGSLAGVRRATREELAAVVGAKSRPTPFLRFSRVGLNLLLLAGHRLRAGFHRVHRPAVLADRARSGARVDGGSAGRSDGAAARPRVAQSDRARRSRSARSCFR